MLGPTDSIPVTYQTCTATSSPEQRALFDSFTRFPNQSSFHFQTSRMRPRHTALVCPAPHHRTGRELHGNRTEG